MSRKHWIFNNRTFPPVRENRKCGWDGSVETGRESAQMGWYFNIAGLLYPEGTVLDVGCGLGEGLDTLLKMGIDAQGIDIDPKLEGRSNFISIKNINEVDDRSFDHVLCIDVIEHVLDDMTFFRNLVRVARKSLYITTPNRAIFNVENECHCREYTHREFDAYFSPNELYGGEASGWGQLTPQLAYPHKTDSPQIMGVWKGNLRKWHSILKS